MTPILQLARLSGFTVGSFVSNESVVDDGELLFSPSGNLFFGNLVDSGNTLFLFFKTTSDCRAEFYSFQIYYVYMYQFL